MTQSTTVTAPDARFGRIFQELCQIVHNLTDEQAAALSEQFAKKQPAINAPERRGLIIHRTMKMIEFDEDTYLPRNEHLNKHGVDWHLSTVAGLLLARDRGLVTEQYFTQMTHRWTTAGLPLPTAITGDQQIALDADISQLTTDALVDELLHFAHCTDQYGAVLALTGYNHGELLAHETIRQFVRRTPAGNFYMDWAALRDAEKDVRCDTFDNIELTAHDVIAEAINMALPDRFDAAQAGSENAEAMLIAYAYALKIPHILAGHHDLPEGPGDATPAAGPGDGETPSA